jgi:hypothetical protein
VLSIVAALEFAWHLKIAQLLDPLAMTARFELDLV